MKTHIITRILLLSVLCSCSSNPKGEGTTDKEKEAVGIAENRLVEVKAKLLGYSDFSYELVSNGIIAAMQKADLRFQSQDIIRKIYVKNGQFVRQGDKIAELDKFRLEMARAQAQEALDRARLDFQDVLIGQGYSLRDSIRIPADVLKIASLRSGYEQSRTNYSIARHNLDAATLYAPFDGVIANLTVKEFNLPGNDAFCVLINNSSPEVIFHILENELPFTNIGDRVIVSPFSQPGYKVVGRISEINPLIDKNGMISVKAVISKRDNKLCEGMNVKIRVQRLLGEQLVIPKSALVLRNNRKVVFTAKNGIANWVYVETAQENSEGYVVTDGLQPGDSIIYDGNINLAHEVKIKVQ